MKTLSRLAPILGRIPLVMATVIFTLISLRFISNPVHAAAATGISFTRPIGITVGRIGFGAFPLGCAIVTALCLISARRLLTGLAFVAIMLGVALLVRILGIAVDHTLAESLRVTVSEMVLLTLSIVGMVAVSARQRLQ
ncbi:MAG TPA: hypothetical protein VLV78_23210 [Thermoanaerobaculia bacterium]|nr:hypothetical protein [Thermoanaerobaculia bacterium]